METQHKTSLHEQESIIMARVQALIEIGDACQEISRRELYKEEGFATFKEYCEQKWEIKQWQVNQFINAVAGYNLSLPFGEL
jgi:hypothetical protein